MRRLDSTRLRCAWLFALCCCAALCSADVAPTLGYSVVARYPRPDPAFTQGLELSGDALYESSGLYGKSYVVKWLPQPAPEQTPGNNSASSAGWRSEARQPLPSPYFAEGLTRWRDRLYVLTWREQRGFILDADTLRQLGEFSYDGEGWGLTHNGRQLIMSDGSARLRFIDPDNLRPQQTITVKDNGRELSLLNELEWVGAGSAARAPRILANVWQTDTIVAIDPDSGAATAWLDLGQLYPRGQRSPRSDVLNGIAFDPRDGTLLVTGKLWPFIYRLRLNEPLP